MVTMVSMEKEKNSNSMNRSIKIIDGLNSALKVVSHASIQIALSCQGFYKSDFLNNHISGFTYLYNITVHT